MGKKSTKTRIGIVGTGAVGTAWALAIRDIGWKVSAIVSRDADKARRLARLVDAKGGTDLSLIARSTMILLCVPDDILETFAEKLCAIPFSERTVSVLHCSGTLTSEVLSRLKQHPTTDISIGSIHPMQTFPSQMTRRKNWKPLRSITFGFEGDSGVVRRLGPLIKRLHGHIVSVPASAKAIYHVGGVITSNFLHAAFHATRYLYKTAGFDAAETAEILGPIIRQSVTNILSEPDNVLLTGPAARGDFEVMAAHSALVREHLNEFKAAFDGLNAYCLHLANQRKV